jgi:hypothetical protein
LCAILSNQPTQPGYSVRIVFGQVIWDEPTTTFFRNLEDIPTYSVDRPSGMDEFATGGVATSVFNAQRDFMRGAAKTLGDARVSNLYDGKLMRRMEVLQVGRLWKEGRIAASVARLWYFATHSSELPLLPMTRLCYQS